VGSKRLITRHPQSCCEEKPFHSFAARLNGEVSDCGGRLAPELPNTRYPPQFVPPKS
jgi:hypothetical protein